MSAKKPFALAVGDIVAKYGKIISRRDLIAYCHEFHIMLPAIIRQYRAGRGFFNLEPLLNMAQQTNSQISDPVPPPPEMTDEEIEVDINSRFASLDLMAYGVVNGDFRSLIVSGNPGTGKTFTLESIMDAAANTSKILFIPVRGYVRATGLYRLMYEARHKECVLLLDDSDSIFQDEISLNLLKAGLDTTKRRHISWRSEKNFVNDEDEDIPKEFDFLGAIVFISNINFQREIARGTKIACHLDALMSRSYYLDLNLLSTRELIVRIKSVVAHTNILSGMKISKKDSETILEYITTNKDKFRELSLRTVIKLGTIWRASAGDVDKFEKMTSATCLVRGR
jgi:hypothetical protein